MSYQDNVQAAAMALSHGEDANWELARLTFESTRERGAHPQPDKATMEQWCAAVRELSGRKFSDSTGALHKRVWGRFGQQFIVDRPSWTDAVLSANSTTDARVDEIHLDSSLRRVSPEKKREIFFQLANDKEVINRETAPDAVAMLHNRHRDILSMPPVPTSNHEQPEAREQDRRTGTAASLGVAELGMCVSQMLSAAAKYRDTLRNMGQLSDMVREAELQSVAYGIERWQDNIELLSGSSVVDDIDAFLKGNRS